MAELRLVSERIRVVELSRDSDPLPGEKPIEQLLVIHDYHRSKRGGRSFVAEEPYVSTKRWQRFVVKKTSDGDALIAALKNGPAKPSHFGNGQATFDLDQMKTRAQGVALGATRRGSTRAAAATSDPYSHSRDEVFHSGSLGQILDVER